MNRNWRRVMRIAFTWGQIQIERLTHVYIWGFIGIVLGVAIAVSLGVFFNQAGIKGGNFVLATIFLSVWAFFTFYPAFLAVMFGVGSLNGLPKDWSLNQLLKEAELPNLQLSEVVNQGLEFVRKVVRWSKHLALFITTVFVVLGSWDIENPRVVLPVFVVLAGIGLLSTLFPTKTIWYKRTVTAILLVSLTGLLYTGYHYFHPQDETVNEVETAIRKNEDNKMDRALQLVLQKIENGGELAEDEEETLAKARRERKSRSLKGTVSNFFYSKILEKDVSSLQPQKLCGVQPGHRKFAIPHESYVILNGDNYEITSFVRVNGTLPNQFFSVGDDGCVDISFSFPSSTLEKTVTPQVIQIAFR